MKSVKAKAKAEKNKLVGAVKERVGKFVGNPGMEAGGRRDRAKGNLQNAAEEVKEAARGVMKR